MNLQPLPNIIDIILLFIINLTIHLKSSLTSPFVEATTTPTNTFHNLHLMSNALVTSDDVTETSIVQSKGVIHCVVVCLDNPHCLSISFNSDTRLCYVNKLTISTPGAVVTYNTAFKYTEISNRVEWHLAFRGTHQIGVKTYDSWIDQGHHDDVTEVTSNTIGCQTVDGRLPCDKHLRTWRLDDWTNVALVKYAFYTDSQEVFYVTFDATGTTSINRDDHFRISNIVASSATELVGYSGFILYNSIPGHVELYRRFYLQQSYNGCENDPGWMLVSDGHNPSQGCFYEATPPYPNFMYTPFAGTLRWGSADTGMAQVFAVFIKYED